MLTGGDAVDWQKTAELTLSESDGQLLVMRVRNGSAMARAGLKAGDRIEIVNGKTVRSPEAFQQALEALTVGREVPIVVVRSEHGEVLESIPRAEDWSFLSARPLPLNLDAKPRIKSVSSRPRNSVGARADKPSWVWNSTRTSPTR